MSEGEEEGMSDGELQSLLDFAVSLAREAGEITLRYFRKEFETRQFAKGARGQMVFFEAEFPQLFERGQCSGVFHGQRRVTQT